MPVRYGRLSCKEGVVKDSGVICISGGGFPAGK